ncbi:MAG: hypothetical protein JNJ71_13130 [Rubrivivax sp.]|nr:hypothetical protein [Rubrivivax sp.]
MKKLGQWLVFWCCAFVLIGTATAQGAAQAVVPNDAISLSRMYADTRSSFVLQGVNVQDVGLANLEIRNAEVFAPGSRLVASDGKTARVLPRPKTRFLRGTINGNARTTAALSITPEGAITGLMTDGMRKWELRRRTADSTIEAVLVQARDPNATAPNATSCGNDRLVEPPQMSQARSVVAPSNQPVPPSLAPGQLYRATIAIETDFEFYTRMGSNPTTAHNYIGNLFNYVSGIYELETQTQLVVGDTFLWTTASDPWVEMGGTWCRLAEFGRYWRDNRGAVTRTLAHFLSGANLGGGIAWLNTLCMGTQSAISPTNCASVGTDFVFGGYGVSANLDGIINSTSGPAWDAVVVAHELGHNFASPHAHCYGGVAGQANPVDACWNTETGNGCYAGASTGLPGVGALFGGTSGARHGTIMSYCHQQNGGIGNIAGTFGKNHLYGVAAGRISDLMANRVAQVATNNPSCLPIVSTATASVQFSAASYTVAENVASGQVTIQVTRGSSAGTASVDYATSNGTASAGSDYTATSGTLNFAAGVSTQSFTVPILNNSIQEPTETLNLALSNPVNLTLGTPSTATISITDDDPVAGTTVQFAAAAYSVGESAGSVTVTVQRSNSVGNASVSYATSNGTATAGSDYVGSGGTLNFTPGVSALSFQVPITNDSSSEPSETFTITLSNATGLTLGATSSTTVTIVDDDAPPASLLQFSAANYSVNEGVASVAITVTRSNTTGTATVSFATANGSALAGSDYTARTGTLSFAAGVASRTFTVAILNDTTPESNETFSIALSSPNGAALGANATTTVTIVDNDTVSTPTIQFSSATASVNEGAGVVNLSVTRSSGAGSSTVNFATASGTATSGADFTATSGQISFAAGETSKTIAVPILNDTAAESTETFTVTLSAPSGATLGSPASATVSIIDNDSPPPAATLQFSASSYSVGESGGQVTITVTRSNGTGSASVNYATSAGTAAAGSDFTATSGTLSFASGETSRTFSVPILNDSTPESTESFNLSLSNPTGGAVLGSPATASVTITDDDSAGGVTVAFQRASLTVGEGATSVAVTVIRSSGVGTATVSFTTVNGSAIAGSDYTARSGTLSFAAGVTSRTFTVAILNDTLAEGAETFSIVLSSPVGATLGAIASTTVTITDND